MRWKDWQPGECRVKVQVVTETGSALDYYLPHASPQDGAALLMLATEIARRGPFKRGMPA